MDVDLNSADRLASIETGDCANILLSLSGHFGVINFPYTIVHPYFLSEVVQILNKICPGCKSIRLAKVRYLVPCA